MINFIHKKRYAKLEPILIKETYKQPIISFAKSFQNNSIVGIVRYNLTDQKKNLFKKIFNKSFIQIIF